MCENIQIKTGRKTDGYTLAEVMVAMALVVLLATGLYAAGLMVMRMTHFNRVSLQARALGIQWLEEISSHSISEIAMQVPFANRTNHAQYGEQIVSSASVVGHTANHGVSTNLATSTYLECHVRVAYTSPLTQASVTNLFSTLIQ